MAKCQHSPLQESARVGKKPFHWKTPSYQFASVNFMTLVRKLQTETFRDVRKAGTSD